MAKNFNTLLYDDAVVRGVLNLKFRDDLVKRIRGRFKTHDDEFLDRLGVILVRMSDRDLERLASGFPLNRGTDRTKALATALRDLTASSTALALQATAELQELAFDEAKFWAGRVNHHLPDALGIDIAEVSQARVSKVWSEFLIGGETINQSIERWGKQRTEALNKVVRQNAFEGLEATATIRGLGGRKGMLARNVDGSPNGLGVKLRTAATASAFAGQKAFAAENDLLNDLVWVATLDTRTSRYCTIRHGKLINKELGGIGPPGHPNCRSISVPGIYQIRRARELNKQLPNDELDIEGRIPDHETAAKWLTRQDQSTQLKVLGRARFELWKTGKFKWPEDFIRQSDGRLWTLKELRERNAAFFNQRAPA